MNAFAYARYELLRTFRNRRFFIFSFGFPLVLYYAIAAPNRNVHNLNHIGHLGADVLHGRPGVVRDDERGPRLRCTDPGERTVGWNRQLRLTPLSVRTYFRVKVLTSYAMALVSDRPALRRGHDSRRSPERAPLGLDDAAHPRRADPLRRARHHDGAPGDRPTRSGLRSAARLLCSRCSAVCGSRSSGGVRCRQSPRRFPRTGSCRQLTSGSAGTAGERRAGRSLRPGASAAALAAARAYQRDTKRA